MSSGVLILDTWASAWVHVKLRQRLSLEIMICETGHAQQCQSCDSSHSGGSFSMFRRCQIICTWWIGLFTDRLFLKNTSASIYLSISENLPMNLAPLPNSIIMLCWSLRDSLALLHNLFNCVFSRQLDATLHSLAINWQHQNGSPQIPTFFMIPLIDYAHVLQLHMPLCEVLPPYWQGCSA